MGYFVNKEMVKTMRKRFMGVMLAAVLATSLVACSKGTKKVEEVSSKNTAITAEEYAGTIKTNADIYKKYVNIDSASYMNREIELDTSAYTVTDDAVETQIQTLLEQLKETQQVTEGETKENDVINLDYSGKLDGVAFQGGTATSVSYTVGSGQFITDLDQGLIGLQVGQTYDIPCTFPSDYSSSDLAGKSVIFTVKVNYIEKEIIPELTDSFVAENASTLGYEGCTTVDELRTAVKASLETQAQNSLVQAKASAVYKLATDGLEVNDYPEDELNQLLDTLNKNIETEYNTYGSYYGITDLETYIKTVYGFENQDAFNDYATDYAKTYLLEKMVYTIIAADNDITVTADEINDQGAQLASQYGYDDYNAILSEYGNEMNAEIGYNCLYANVAKFLSENCTLA